MVTSIAQSKCIKLWLSGISQSICITVFQDETNLASKDLSLVIAKYSKHQNQVISRITSQRPTFEIVADVSLMSLLLKKINFAAGIALTV